MWAVWQSEQFRVRAALRASSALGGVSWSDVTSSESSDCKKTARRWKWRTNSWSNVNTNLSGFGSPPAGAEFIKQKEVAAVYCSAAGWKSAVWLLRRTTSFQEDLCFITCQMKLYEWWRQRDVTTLGSREIFRVCSSVKVNQTRSHCFRCWTHKAATPLPSSRSPAVGQSP